MNRGSDPICRAVAGAMPLHLHLPAGQVQAGEAIQVAGAAPDCGEVIVRLDGRICYISRSRPGGQLAFELPALAAGEHSLRAECGQLSFELFFTAD